MRHGEVTNVHDAQNSVFSWGFLYSFQSYHINYLLEGAPTDPSYLPRHTWKSPEDGVKAKAGILALILVICNQKIDRWERAWDMESGETGKGRGVEGRGEGSMHEGWYFWHQIITVLTCWIFWKIFGLTMVFLLLPFPLQKNAPNLHRGLEDFAIFSCTVSAYLWVFIW